MALGREISFIGKGGPRVFKAGPRDVGPTNTARTQAFINALALDGVTLSNTIIGALNVMDNSLISAGLLPAGTGAGKIKALYPIVGGSATAHKYNFVDPRDLNAAFRLSFSGGWTHSSTGMLPNGVNAYADTFLFQNILGQNNQHIATYTRQNAILGGSGSIGCDINDTFMLIRLAAFYGNCNDGDFNISTNANAGLFHTTRTGANIRKSYRNGVEVINTIVSSNANVNQSFYISALNNGGPAAFFDNLETAFVSIGEGLSALNSTNLYTSVQQFQTTLGRQV
jgi:hypothetical protein